MMDLFATGGLPALAREVLAVLFDLTVKGTLILALAGVLTTLLKNTSASTRHQIWCLALCSMLLLPVLTVTLPAWRVPILAEIPYFQAATASLDRAAQAEPASAIPVDEAVVDAATSMAPTASWARADGAASESEGAVSVSPPLAYETVLGPFYTLYESTRAASWPVWLLVIWAGGVAMILFRFLLGAAGVAWLAYRARPIHDAVWTDLTGEIRSGLGVRRRVRLLRSMHTAMPMTWGLLRPVVLLPVRADDWSEARRRCVLTHELAHIRRWDCLTQTLAQAACALSWFNPLVWVAARRMRHERELACDDFVLGSAIRPSEYAAHLLDIARTSRTTLVAPLGAVAMAHTSQLEGRVLSILDAARKRNGLGRLATVGSVVMTVALVMPLAALRPAGGDAAPSDHAFQRVVTQHGEAYQWTGRIEPGKTVDIRGMRGRLQATPASGEAVMVTAWPRDEAFAGAVRVVEKDGDLVICLPHPDDPETCAADTGHGETMKDQAEVDFVAHIPQGVHFSGQTLNGAVTVVGLQSDVEAATVAGDIFVQATGTVSAHAVAGDIKLRTASYARASTHDGDIHARLGRTDWTGPLPFNSATGDITVELPEDAHTDIDLHIEADGHLQSALALSRRSREQGERFRGRLGQGGRLLAIHTKDGNITITHRGNETVKPLSTFEVRAPKNDIRPDRRERPVYRAEARPAPPKTKPVYAEARRKPAARPEPNRASYAPEADLDLGAGLLRLRRQIYRLDADLSQNLFEGAAQAINGLQLGISVNPRDLVELVQIVDGHDTHYARQLHRLGFGEAPREDVLLARLVGVNAGYVRSVRDAGYCPSLKEFAALKVAGIDREYLQDMASEGYEELPVKALVELRTSGVDKKVIHEMEEQGIRAPTVEEMVEFKSEHGPVPK